MGLFEQALRQSKKIRHKVFVSYHHSGDQNYYNKFSDLFHDTYEAITDNSLEQEIDSENVDYVMRRIREDYITGTSCTIVLVGEHTWGRKYVDWEIKATLDKDHALIGVQLPSATGWFHDLKIPARLEDNIKSGYAVWITWEQFTASSQALERTISDAKSRATRLIDNSRDRRLRNA